MSIIRLNAVFAYRTDTLENWQDNNTLLERGEISIVIDKTDTPFFLKIGDGVHGWNDLPYAKGPQGIQGIQGPAGADGQDGVYITGAEINSSGHLIITLSDESSVDAGYAKGSKGDTGEQGPQGIQGIQGPKGDKGDDGITPDMSNYYTKTEIEEVLIGKSTENGGEIFNDYENNKALAEKASASGQENSAGCKGWLISTIDTSNLTITLVGDISNISVDDNYSIHTEAHYNWVGKITAVDTDTSTVTVDSLPSDITYESEISTFHIPEKPTAGVYSIGEAAFVTGISNKINEKGGFAAGKENIVDASYGGAVGTNNKVKYASFAAGKGNTSGEFGIIGGINNKDTGRFNTVSGNANNNSGGENDIISGNSNRNSGNCNVVGGQHNNVSKGNNLVVGQENFVNGNGNIVGGEKNGNTSAKIKGDHNIIGGYNNSNNGYYNFVSGNGNANNGTHNLISGGGNTVNGNYSGTAGQNNDVTSDCAFAFGNGCQATKWGSMAVNQGKAKGNGSFAANLSSTSAEYASAFGRDNLAKHKQAAVFGQGNKSSRANQTVMGSGNADDAEAYLIVGCNNSDHNAFAVLNRPAIKVGNTTLTESQLQQLLALLS